MTDERTVPLLAVEPGLGRYLDEGEQQDARRIALPVHELGPGPFDAREFFEDADAFGAIVLEGIILQRLRVSDQVAVRLIGPGDMISLTEQPRSMLLLEAEPRVVEEARDVDQECVEQLDELVRVQLQIVDVVLVALDSELSHPLGHPPLNGRALIAGEIEPP